MVRKLVLDIKQERTWTENIKDLLVKEGTTHIAYILLPGSNPSIRDFSLKIQDIQEVNLISVRTRPFAGMEIAIDGSMYPEYKIQFVRQLTKDNYEYVYVEERKDLRAIATETRMPESVTKVTPMVTNTLSLYNETSRVEQINHTIDILANITTDDLTTLDDYV